MGKVTGGTAPIFPTDLNIDPTVTYSNPLPHVLILTAIVVGIATTSLGLALIIRIREEYGTIEEEDILEAENMILMAQLQKNDDQSVVSTNTATANKSARSTKTTVSTTQRIAAALKELAVLKANKEIQATATINVPITPLAPTNIEQTGTEVDGAGKNI